MVVPGEKAVSYKRGTGKSKCLGNSDVVPPDVDGEATWGPLPLLDLAPLLAAPLRMVPPDRLLLVRNPNPYT